MFENKIGAIS